MTSVLITKLYFHHRWWQHSHEYLTVGSDSWRQLCKVGIRYQLKKETISDHVIWLHVISHVPCFYSVVLNQLITWGPSGTGTGQAGAPHLTLGMMTMMTWWTCFTVLRRLPWDNPSPGTWWRSRLIGRLSYQQHHQQPAPSPGRISMRLYKGSKWASSTKRPWWKTSPRRSLKGCYLVQLGPFLFPATEDTSCSCQDSQREFFLVTWDVWSCRKLYPE